MSKPDNPFAFPVLPPVDETGRIAVGCPDAEGGLTMRDYFAAKAMQAMIASGLKQEWSDESISNSAYCIASAMLRAREAS